MRETKKCGQLKTVTDIHNPKIISYINQYLQNSEMQATLYCELRPEYRPKKWLCYKIKLATTTAPKLQTVHKVAILAQLLLLHVHILWPLHAKRKLFDCRQFISNSNFNVLIAIGIHHTLTVHNVVKVPLISVN